MANNVTGQLDFGQYQGYSPYSPSGSRLYGQLGDLQEYGQGLMDPGSEYYQGLSREMQQTLGQQGAAAERAAALRSAYGGLGGGQGAELLATQGDIAQSTLEAQGAAQADLALQAPQVGAAMLQSTFAPELGLQQMGEGSRQYGHGMAEDARQFGAQMGLAQQQMAQQRAMQEAQLAQQYEQMQLQADLARQQMEHEFALQQSRAGYMPTGDGIGGGIRGGSGIGWSGGTPRRLGRSGGGVGSLAGI